MSLSSLLSLDIGLRQLVFDLGILISTYYA